MSDPPKDVKHRATYSSSLTLLANHSELFSKQLFDDFDYWHHLLVDKWLKMDWKYRIIAMKLLHSFHREIADQLLPNDDENDARRLEILNFLRKYFKTTLEQSNSQPFEIRIAISGFGLMAAPCKRLLPPESLNELLQLVMQRTENASHAVDETSKEQFEHFPDYVESLAKIMEHVNELTGIQLTTLKNIIVSLIRNFHLLSTVHHRMTIDTLMRTFHNLWLLGETHLDDVLEKVVYQGVVWTCSHKLPFEVLFWDPDADWKEQITFKSYLSLWNGLMAEVDLSSYNRLLISSKIYDHLMKTLFTILERLNLSTRKRTFHDANGKDQELYFSNPNYELEPSKPKDFHIFFNLVDFYCALWKTQSTKSHLDNSSKWIPQLVDTIILHSLKHPLVSGFVKILHRAICIINQIDYFDEKLQNQNENLKLDSELSVKLKISHYLTNTTKQIEQMNGEQQLACLKLLFCAPTSMLTEIITDMIPAFVTAFEIGKSSTNLFIADMALGAIERFITSNGNTFDETKNFLQEVMPHLDSYLQGFKMDAIRTTAVAYKRVGLAKQSPQQLIQINETNLLQFQKRIIRLLGALEPEQCLYLLHNDKNAKLVKWDATEKVCLTLFGPNFNPKIHLDALMPRMCEIATSSTDRQKKMAACEFIHATILYLIGSNNHDGQLWSELCEKMLELGCDGDIGVQQMFEPLIMQIMRYTSQYAESRKNGIEILLDRIMAAISKPSNSGVRDLSARALRKFIEWAIKQSTEEQLKTSPYNITTIINKLKVFCLDVNQDKRFGAALAFNNVYRILREEDTIVDIYWLDLLHDFCVNFVMSEQYMEKNLNYESNLKQISICLDHILRVLRERKNIFNEATATRIKPTSFEGVYLQDAIDWLFTQLTTNQHIYRRKVSEMILLLAPCIDGFDSASSYAREALTSQEIVNLCEANMPPQVFDRQSKSFSIVDGLNAFQRSLENYMWFLVNSLLPAQNIQTIFDKSVIFTAINHYIENIMNENVMNLFTFDSEDESMLNDQIVDTCTSDAYLIRRTKTIILIRLFEFLSKFMLPGYVQWIPATVWTSFDLMSSIEKIAFSPQTLECDIRNPQTLSKLQETTNAFILSAIQHAPDHFKKELLRMLSENAQKHYEELTELTEAYLSLHLIRPEHLKKLIGIELVFDLMKTKRNLFSENMRTELDISAGKTLHRLSDGIKENVNDEYYAKFATPDVLKFTNKLLSLSFRRPDAYIYLIDVLLYSEALKIPNTEKNIKHGKHFFSLYKTAILEYFMTCITVIVDRFVIKMGNPNYHYILRIFIELTEYAYKQNYHNVPRTQELSNALLNNWTEIQKKAPNQDPPTLLTMIELMTHLAMIVPFKLSIIAEKAPSFRKWLLDIIENSTVGIEIKSQAFFLLPCLIDASSIEEENRDVQKALEAFQSKHFPLLSTEFAVGSIERATFENTFQIVLDTLCASKASIILKFIINCTATDPKHIMDYKIAEIIPKFMRQLQSSEQMRCLNIAFKLFTNTQLEPTIRVSMLKRFLTTLIRNSQLKTILQFYTDHICEIDHLIKSAYDASMSNFKLHHAFISRAGGFELLEIMIAMVPTEQIQDANCPIAVAIRGKLYSFFDYSQIV